MATTQSTKQLVALSEIRDGVVILKNRSLRAIIDVASTNFELRSEEEQTAVLQNFQRFLNSVDFPLQMVVQSRKLNIQNYLTFVEQASTKLTNELLRIQAAEYIRFVSELSDLANIMSKNFFIVVPFYVSEATASESTGVFGGFKTLLRSAPATLGPEASDEKFVTYKNQLLQRSELVLDSLVSLGLKAKLLTQEELVDLFSALYNPDTKNT